MQGREAEGNRIGETKKVVWKGKGIEGREDSKEKRGQKQERIVKLYGWKEGQ